MNLRGGRGNGTGWRRRLGRHGAARGEQLRTLYERLRIALAIKHWHEPFTIPLIILLATAVGLFAPHFLPGIGTAESWSSDVRVALLTPPQPQHPDIVIVTITEDTLATLPYRSPIDRSFIADLIQKLDAAGARAVGIDVLFDQPTEATKDERLREVIQSSRAPVTVAWATTDDQLTERQSQFLTAFVQGVDHGYVNLITDPQLGTVRWFTMNREENGKLVPSFVGSLAGELGLSPPVTKKKPLGPISLAYRPSPDAETPAFRSFPAHLVKVLPAAWFKDKVVLIGADLPHSDRHRSPWAAGLTFQTGALPGIVIHAHALAQLMDGRRAPGLSTEMRALTAAGAAIVGLIFAGWSLSLPIQLALAPIFLTALWVGGFVFYALTGILLALVAMSISFTVSWAIGNAYWRGKAWRQREFIRTAFSQFAAPAVVERLIADPRLLTLGGEKRELSCVFTDLAGFTTWFERTDPQEALAVLNEYLDGMCDIAIDFNGTIDKIVGDALHIIFSAPLTQPDHAERAVRCALALANFSREFAAAQNARGVPLGLTRIGVHSGPAVVGNFGGKRFFDYTAYGDMVNTTARLESVNKSLGGTICVSEAAANRCPNMTFRPIGRLLLVGKTQPIDTWEPLTEDSPALTSLANYLEAFALMKDDNPRAAMAFYKLQAMAPDDWLVRLHAGRFGNGEKGALIVLKEK